MTNYICAELVETPNGYHACKTWVVYDGTTWVDKLAITKQEMVVIGGSIIGVMSIILAFTLIAYAAKRV